MGLKFRLVFEVAVAAQLVAGQMAVAVQLAQCTCIGGAVFDDSCCGSMQSLPEMIVAPQPALEAFLTDVYRALGGAAPLKDKVSSIAIMVQPVPGGP